MATDIEYALMAGRVYEFTRNQANWLPDLRSQGWLRRALLITVAVCTLGGCTQMIEYEEEVALGDPPKIELIKRREVLACNRPVSAKMGFSAF